MSNAALTPLFSFGDRVRIVGGPYTGWEGHVVTSGGTDRLAVELLVFGVRKIVDLAVWQIQRA